MNAFTAWSVLVVCVCALTGFSVWHTHDVGALWALVILIMVTPKHKDDAPKEDNL